MRIRFVSNKPIFNALPLRVDWIFESFFFVPTARLTAIKRQPNIDSPEAMNSYELFPECSALTTLLTRIPHLFFIFSPFLSRRFCLVLCSDWNQMASKSQRGIINKEASRRVERWLSTSPRTMLGIDDMINRIPGILFAPGLADERTQHKWLQSRESCKLRMYMFAQIQHIHSLSGPVESESTFPASRKVTAKNCVPFHSNGASDTVDANSQHMVSHILFFFSRFIQHFEFRAHVNAENVPHACVLPACVARYACDSHLFSRGFRPGPKQRKFLYFHKHLNNSRHDCHREHCHCCCAYHQNQWGKHLGK